MRVNTPSPEASRHKQRTEILLAIQGSATPGRVPFRPNILGRVPFVPATADLLVAFLPQHGKAVTWRMRRALLRGDTTSC